MAESALVDLVCGPASPLPETYQRYRLVARIGSGGQADVYRGVRLCGGVTSAPITVKVFRIDPRRPLADELRSWDKGDAVLMDLNNRGVTGICRRADGFYGPPPHASGAVPSIRNAVPYQIYDYLHGVNLREYVMSKAGISGPRLNAGMTLRTLAEATKALHHPIEPGACPVLHMDIKPSNLMVLTNGEVRLIDFTGARYWRREEITQIAYTPESGGPEALRGEVSPSYDVHGFGAVAFFMLTGTPPRGPSAPPMDRHPIFVGRPALRDHLLAPLADQPFNRPSTAELAPWVDRLMMLVRAADVPDLGLDWADPQASGSGQPASDSRRAVGRAKPVIAGTETDAFMRIEMLERELVRLRATTPAGPQPDLQPMPASVTPAALLAPTSGHQAIAPVSGVPVSALPVSGVPVSGMPVSAQPVSGSSLYGQPVSVQPVGSGPHTGSAKVVPPEDPDGPTVTSMTVVGPVATGANTAKPPVGHLPPVTGTHTGTGYGGSVRDSVAPGLYIGPSGPPPSGPDPHPPAVPSPVASQPERNPPPRNPLVGPGGLPVSIQQDPVLPGEEPTAIGTVTGATEAGTGSRDRDRNGPDGGPPTATGTALTSLDAIGSAGPPVPSGRPPVHITPQPTIPDTQSSGPAAGPTTPAQQPQPPPPQVTPPQQQEAIMPQQPRQQPTPAPPTSAQQRPVSGPPVAMLVGRATVVHRTPQVEPTGYAVDSPRPPALVRKPRGDRLRTLKRGGGWTVTGMSFSLICWIIWATANRSTAGLYLAPSLFAAMLVVALGVFVVLRLLGRLVIEGWMRRVRRGARGAHLGTAVFLVAVGVTYLQQTVWVMTAFHWVRGLA